MAYPRVRHGKYMQLGAHLGAIHGEDAQLRAHQGDYGAIEEAYKLKEALEGEQSRILEYLEEVVTNYKVSIKFWKGLERA